MEEAHLSAWTEEVWGKSMCPQEAGFFFFLNLKVSNISAFLAKRENQVAGAVSQQRACLACTGHWVPSPVQAYAGLFAHACNPTPGRCRQECQRPRFFLSYTANPRPTWDMWDPAIKKKNTQMPPCVFFRTPHTHELVLVAVHILRSCSYVLWIITQSYIVARLCVCYHICSLWLSRVYCCWLHKACSTFERKPLNMVLYFTPWMILISWLPLLPVWWRTEDFYRKKWMQYFCI